eukprot:SAG31_NODE_11598_length_1014_cov_1.855738_1_plen_80_part_10
MSNIIAVVHCVRYIPRGWVHVAKTEAGGPSMHLTITAASQDFSVGNFLKQMIRHFYAARGWGSGGASVATTLEKALDELA